MILEDIKVLKDSFSNCQFNWIKRQANIAIHELSIVLFKRKISEDDPFDALFFSSLLFYFLSPKHKNNQFSADSLGSNLG